MNVERQWPLVLLRFHLSGRLNLNSIAVFSAAHCGPSGIHLVSVHARAVNHPFLPLTPWSTGVCRQDANGNGGARGLA